MKIFRFDEEVSIPGLGFRVAIPDRPLTDDDSHVRVQSMYLPPDGGIGRHARNGPSRCSQFSTATAW